MNTKTTKFLAVLAVLAVAFAVFAVSVPSEESDAGTISADMTISAQKDTWTAAELAYDEIYVSDTVSITVDGAFTSDSITFYVLSGKTATFIFNTAQDATVAFQSAKSGTESVDDAKITLSAVATGSQFTMEGADASLSMGVTSTAAFTIPADSEMYVAEQATVVVDESATMTITGTLETEGTITNGGSIYAGNALMAQMTSVTGHIEVVGSTFTGYTGSIVEWSTGEMTVDEETTEAMAYSAVYTAKTLGLPTASEVTFVSGTTTLTAPIWDIQTVTVAKGATLIVDGVSNAGTIDVFGTLVIGTEDANAATFTNNNLTVIEKGAKLTINNGKTIANAGALVFDASATIAAGVLTNTGTIFVENGTLDLSAYEAAEAVAVTGGTLKIQGEVEATAENPIDPVEGITYFSGKVIHVDVSTDPDTEADCTKVYIDPDNPPVISVDTINKVALAIEGGATSITLASAQSMSAATQDIVVPAGVTLTLTGELTLAKTDTYFMKTNGGRISGTITDGTHDWVIDLAGSYKLKAGSLIVDGTITGEGSITPAEGQDTVITGTLAGELVIEKNEGNVIFDNFTIASTGVLTLDYDETGMATENTYFVKSTANPKDTAYMYIYGKIKCAADDDVSITVQGADAVKKKATVVAYNGATVYGKILIEGTGDYYSIDLSAAMKVLEINTDITKDKEFGQLEDVIVVESLTISNGAKVTVYGSFTIAAGKTVTLEDGAQLIVESTIANVDLSGRLIVETGTYFIVEVASSVSISGALVSEGTASIDAVTTVKKGGSIDIRDDAEETTITSLTVNSGGNVTLRSDIAGSTITNKGTVTLQNAVMTEAIDIMMAGNDATVDVKSVSGNFAFTVTDTGMSFGDYDYTSGTASKTVTYPNTVTFTPAAAVVDEHGAAIVKGLTIVESITSYDYDGKSYYQNNMILSGTVTALDEDGTVVGAIINATGEKYLQVKDALTLGKSIELAVGGILDVDGLLTATATSSEITGTDGTTEINANGAIVTIKAIDTDIINAAMFTSEDDDGNTLFNYVPLLVALEAGADTINVYGKIYVDSDYTIPAEVSIKVNENAEVYIGSNNGDTEITVENGAAVKGNGTIYVDGTLIYENKKDSKVNTISDVYVAGDVACMYTNVYTALANAQSGDTVTLSKSTELVKNVTVKDGVELYVPATYQITVDDGVTLTVNGTLNTVEPVLAETAFANKASVLNKTSAIAVNGVFKSLSKVQYDGTTTQYMIPGAYYTISGFDYVSPLATAVSTTATTIYIYGPVTAGDVAYKGTSTSTKYLYVAADSSLTMGTLTLDYVVFQQVAAEDDEEASTFTGTIVHGDAAVTAVDVNLLNVACVDGSDDILYVSSVVTAEEDSAFVVSAGQVAVGAVLGELVIAEGAEMVIPSSGTAAVGTAYVLGQIIVYGTLTVGSGESLEGELAVISVLGTLDVASETDTQTAGTLDVAGIYAGITAEDFEELMYNDISASAVLSGPMTYDILVAMPSATINDETVKDMKYTSYYVDGAEYVTIYVPDTTGDFYINEVLYSDESVDFNGWLLLGEETVIADTVKIGATGYELVYASIDENVYTLFVRTDNGIKSVAVDGKELINVGNNVFVSYSDAYDLGFKMSAGKYTISFTLKDGYEGTPILYDADGKAVIGGYGITIDGADRTVTYQLNGTDPIPQPEPTPEPEKESEWTITTILLVVLVILIAIMAVIVALRLNRN